MIQTTSNTLYMHCSERMCICCRPLIGLIKGHVISVQIKASLAVEVLADHNENSQAVFLAHDAGKALIRLLKVQTLFPHV